MSQNVSKYYNIHKIKLNVLKKIKVNDFENHNYQNSEEF